MSGSPTPRPGVATVDSRYQLFLATSLALALGLGFLLAVLLGLAEAFAASWGLRWQALAQVHGQLQFLGFAGCFVAGMAFRLMPRFSGTSLRLPGAILPVYVLLVGGLVLRALTQPLNDVAAFAWGPATAGGCLAGAALLFGATVLPTLARPLRERRSWAAFAAAGAVWFAVQGLLGAWFLTALSLHGSAFNAAPGGRTVLPPARDSALLTIQLYGFLLNFIFAVSGRTVPVFFAFRPPRTLPAVAWISLQLGICLDAAATLSGSSLQPLAVWGQAAGLLCLGVSLIAAAAWTGCWRPASRLRPSSRPAASLLRTAYLCCAAAGALNVVYALHDAIEGQTMPGDAADAVRHLLALGVVTMLIVAMAHLVEPSLAAERFRGVPARRRLTAIHLLLVLAIALRVAPPLLNGLGVPVEFGLLSVAGVLAWLAVAVFGGSLWLAYRGGVTKVPSGAPPGELA